MTTTLLAPPSPVFRAARLATSRSTVPRADGRPTLEGMITGAWEGLVASRGVGCPVCGGHMAPRYGASGAAPVGGRCNDCGSTLG